MPAAIHNRQQSLPLQAPVALAADSVVEFLQDAGAAIAADNASSVADLAGRAALDAVIATSLAAASQPIAVRAMVNLETCCVIIPGY